MQLAALLGVVFCLLPGFTNSEVFSSVADMQVDTVFHQGKSKLALDTKSLLMTRSQYPVTCIRYGWGNFKIVHFLGILTES